MENNIQNKEKFFAQYYGQNILHIPVIGETFRVDKCISINHIREGHLELKLLSNITDEDAIILAGKELGDNKNTKDIIRHSKDKIKYIGVINFKFQDADLVRRLGYALEWMGLSVEEQVSRGWVKLKDN